MLKDYTSIPFDIIIQAGQSNADGTGYGLLEDTEAYVPDPSVLYLNRDGTISVAAERVCANLICGDFSLAFAREYLRAGRLAEGRSLLIVRAAVGGTGFRDHRWGLADDLYLQLLDMTKTALALNPANELKVFLWHQGENESCYTPEETHVAQLQTLLRNFREAFRCPGLPFIAGDFVEQWRGLGENPEMYAPVRAAIRRVCAENTPAAFVETEGLRSNDEVQSPPGDTIHFCREALYTLGERYFKRYAALCPAARQ